MGLGNFELRSGDPESKLGGLWSAMGSGQPGRYAATSHEAMSHPAVYTSVRILSTMIASFPVDIYDRKTKAKLEKPEWLRKPNPYMAWPDFCAQLVTSLCLDGNAYVPHSSLRGKTEMNVIAPGRVELDIMPTGELVYAVDTDQHAFRSNEILHFRAVTMPGSLIGLSPITANRATITRGLRAEELGSELYQNGLAIPGAIKYAKKLTQDSADMIQDRIAARHAVRNNSSRVLVIDDGGEWQNINISPADAQFLETMKFTSIQIAMMYGIPPFIVDPSVTSSWGTGIEQQNIRFVQMSLGTWIKNIESVIDAFLLPPDQYIKFNINALLRGDSQARSLLITRFVQNGILTPNEGRMLEEWEPVDSEFANSLQQPLYLANSDQQTAMADLDMDEQKADIERLKQEIENLKNQGGLNQ